MFLRVSALIRRSRDANAEVRGQILADAETEGQRVRNKSKRSKQRD